MNDDLTKQITNLTPTKRALLDLMLEKRGAFVADEQRIARRINRDSLPLSFAQQRLWFLDQLEPGGYAYNALRPIRMRGRLNVKALEESLNEIIRRHEVLRTTFAAVEGEPVQVISPEAPLSLEVRDLTGIEEEAREDETRRLIQQEAESPFDLSRGPLLRVHLLKLGDEEHVLLINVHHIISDAWSAAILFRELGALYGAFLRGEESPSSLLARLPIQYADYAVWQREHLQGEVLLEHLSYWREQLRGAPAVLALPTDRGRPPVQSFRGARQSLVLSKDLTDRLKDLSQEEGVTLFMTLLAAWQSLLSRYTGQEDIVVGSPIAGRTRGETEALIGFFVNTLVLRMDMTGDPTFRELLGRAKEVAVGAYAHQDLPFEKLVEELRPDRSLSHAPLFQVMFTLENAPATVLELHGLKLSLMDAYHNTLKFDLTFFMWEEGGVLKGTLEYSTDLFEEATIRRMLDHFGVLLEGAAADPDRRLSRLPLLTDQERHQLCIEWNDTEAKYPRDRCPHELFEEQVKRTPDAVAVRFQAQRLSYRELNRRANQLAHHLRGLGVGPETRVGIMTERSPEMVVGLLGILKAGGAYVPLDPSYPQERLSFMLVDAQVKVLLTESGLLTRLPREHGAPVLCLDRCGAEIERESAADPRRIVTPENLAYVLYTSGSTGVPKGVMIPHRGLTNYLCWCLKEYAVADGQGAPVHSSIGFDLTITSLFSPLVVGQSVTLLSEGRGVEPLQAALLQRAGREFSLVKITPSHLEALSQLLPAAAASHLARALIIGGEALMWEDLWFWRTYAPETRLINEYGPTEAVVGCCVYEAPPPLPRGDDQTGPVPIGRPIANAQIYILDQHLEPVPVGVAGEIYIGGEGLARGYLNRPALTAERFIANPFSGRVGARLYRTGDLARHLSTGEIQYLGRLDDQVKIRGYRIELGEIEAVLSAHEGVRESAVVVREDEGDRRLVAYVVPARQPAPTIDELRSYLKDKLPDYMVPSACMLLAELPLTSNGKVDRRALPAPDQVPLEMEGAYVAPRTPTEEAVANLFAQVLKVEQVGAYDNFFELGGHSLLATQFISQGRTVFQVDLQLRALFESPTVAEFSEAIERIKGSGHFGIQPEPQVMPISREKYRMNLSDS